jgi:hypothetical protein
LSKLQIGIPCGPNGENYAAFLIATIEETISRKNDYEYIIGINQKGVNKEIFQNILNLKVVEEYKGYPHVKGHGHCLDLLLCNMNSKYGMFVDSDVAFLKKDWDIDLISKINGKTIIVGSEYHPTDGKIVDFPNPITSLFDVEKIKSLNLSFIPKLEKITANEDDCEYYGVKPGQTVFLDTGCHVAKDIKQAGYQGYTMKIVTPRYEDRIGQINFMKIGMRGEEYQLDGIPICTHIGRALTRNFNYDPIVNEWKNRVVEWIKNG